MRSSVEVKAITDLPNGLVSCFPDGLCSIIWTASKVNLKVFDNQQVNFLCAVKTCVMVEQFFL